MSGLQSMHQFSVSLQSHSKAKHSGWLGWSSTLMGCTEEWRDLSIQGSAKASQPKTAARRPRGEPACNCLPRRQTRSRAAAFQLADVRGGGCPRWSSGRRPLRGRFEARRQEPDKVRPPATAEGLFRKGMSFERSVLRWRRPCLHLRDVAESYAGGDRY